ncbi:MAG: AMP-binding protein [Kiloniellaceae bacterium]
MEEPWTLQTLLRAMAPRGNQPAVMAVRRGEAVETWSYARIADHAWRLAAGLAQAGVRPGEPVALCAPNRPEWVVVGFAIIAAGALVVPIDDLSTDAELAATVTDSNARWVFTTGAHLAALRSLPNGPDLKLFVLDDGAAQAEDVPSWLSLLAERSEGLPDLDPEAPAMLVYTSGTTDAPKPFTLSHANLAANVQAIASENLLGPARRVLLPLPLHHAYPFVIGLLTPLTSGATGVFPEAVTGPHLLEALRAAKVTVMVGVPRLYSAMLSGLQARVAARGRVAKLTFRGLLSLATWALRRFGLRVGRGLFGSLHAQIGPDLRLMVSGGARLEPEVIWALEGLGWQVLSGYGLAETGSVFTGNLPGRQRIGSEGRPLAGGEIHIAEPDADGIGEIQLRGDSVFSGYRNNPQANREAFTADGWFRTGDLGYLDADGYLYVTGRAKEMIVLGGGKNVFPEELEKTYSASPFIREIAVLERSGRLFALVLPDLEAIQATSGARIEDVLRVTLHGLGLQLPSYRRLSGFAIAREPLPRTRLGKYRRFFLPELYEQAEKGAARVRPAEPSEQDRALLAGSPAREVWDLLATRYPQKSLALDASPQLDLGVDSLEWLSLTIELNDRLGIRLTEEDIARVATVRDLLHAAADAARRVPDTGAEAGPEGARPDEARWLSPTGPALAALAVTVHAVNRLTMRLVFRLRAVGIEHLPRQGPYMLAANHVSDLDPLALAAALPAGRIRQVYWGGDAARLFSNPGTRLLCRALHIFPLDERFPDSSLAMGSAILARGNVLAWFPEAWRSPTGELQRFLPGIGRLLARSGVPVVPVVIRGTFEAMPRWRRLPRPHRIRVTFGYPLETAKLEASGHGATPESRIAEALRHEVAQLGRESAPEERR